MARYPQNSPQIEHLIRLSAASRNSLSRQSAVLRQRLVAPTRVLQSLRHHPAAWLGGTFAAGLLTSLILRRKSAPAKSRRSWRSHLGALALTAIRPVIKTWITVQLQQFLAAHLRAAAGPAADTPNRATPRHPL